MKKDKKAAQNNQTAGFPTWISEVEKLSVVIDLIRLAYQIDCDCEVCKKLKESAQAFEELMKNYLK